MGKKVAILAPLAIMGILLFIAIGGELVYLLWNWLVPPLLGLPRITFWQALGILVLCRILFGGFRSHSHTTGRSGLRRRIGERMAERAADRWAARWERMTPEERERFRQGVRARCGFDPADGSGDAK